MTIQDTIVELNGLIRTCKDGELGYRTAAADVRNTELETIFAEYSKQRGQFARKLKVEVERLGGDAEGAGSMSGTLLRGWMDFKSALTRGNGAAILATCETGEEVAVAAFEWVVNLDISGQTRSLVVRQSKIIKEAHARLLRLKAEEATGARFQKNDKLAAAGESA
jgi:uncharacterized protein (TIGR02284 family)